MARISGVDLPNDKRVEIGLTYIYGIGRTTAKEVIAATGINPDTRCRDLTEDDVKKLSDYITNNLTVEGDLRRNVAYDIKRMIARGTSKNVFFILFSLCNSNDYGNKDTIATENNRELKSFHTFFRNKHLDRPTHVCFCLI